MATRLARRLGSRALDAAAAEGRRVREWARTWLERWRATPEAGYASEIARLNGLLVRCAARPEVVATDGGFAIVEHVHVEDGGALAGLIALQIAELVTEEDARRVKACGGSGCTLWFLDRTKAQRRVFCSSSTCGNRARVAAFRQRQREG